MQPASPAVAVFCDPGAEAACTQLSQQLSIPLEHKLPAHSTYPFLLMLTDDGLVLQRTGGSAPGPVGVDFTAGASDFRRSHGGGELIVKAVGGSRANLPTVLDATAGLGRDSFVLASRGYRVAMCERVPVIAALLADGLRRACEGADGEVAAITGRMQLHAGNAMDYLRDCGEQQRPDVVVIDPMFPASRKSALVKKEMQAFQAVVGADSDSEQLLDVALATARHRVVVKRPRKGEWMGNRKPGFAVSGKAVRFDVYAIRAYGK